MSGGKKISRFWEKQRQRVSGATLPVPPMPIKFGDEEKAKRIIRALNHAVKLCGGKVEPFSSEAEED
jgi:hypothetical protein